MSKQESKSSQVTPDFKVSAVNYLASREVSDAVFKVINGTKQVTRLAFTADQFYAYWVTFWKLNALPKYTTDINSRSLSAYKHAAFMKGLVQPEQVVISTAYSFMQDQGITKSEWDEDQGLLSPDDFNEISGFIVGARREDAATVLVPFERPLKLSVTLESLDKYVSMSGSIIGQTLPENIIMIQDSLALALNIDRSKQALTDSEGIDLVQEWVTSAIRKSSK